MSKQSEKRKNKVVKVWTLDENNIETLAEKLNQPLAKMFEVLLIAQVNDREIHVIEYRDRYELQQTAAGKFG